LYPILVFSLLHELSCVNNAPEIKVNGNNKNNMTKDNGTIPIISPGIKIEYHNTLKQIIEKNGRIVKMRKMPIIFLVSVILIKTEAFDPSPVNNNHIDRKIPTESSLPLTTESNSLRIII
jgi:hypothetical protein